MHTLCSVYSECSLKVRRNCSYSSHCKLACHPLYDACMNITTSIVNVQDEFGAKDYTKLLDLKLDHVSRPIWVVRHGQTCVFWDGVM